MRPRGAGTVALVALVLVAFAFVAPGTTAVLPVGGLAPQPRTSGGAVQWSPVGVESAYKVAVSTGARGASERSTVYANVPRQPGETQSYTPAVPAGKTIYVGVSSDGGAIWSSAEAPVSNPPAPGMQPTDEGPTGTPNGASGEAAPPEAQTQTFPSDEEVSEAEASAQQRSAERAAARRASASGPIIGTNDGAGWGAAAARTIVQGHITWNRVELGSGPNTLSSSLADGFKVLAIVKNISDSTPLSQVNPSQWGAAVAAELKANSGISIAEAANESYYKGGVANPVQYGRMYLAAVEDIKSAGIKTPLLFDMTGDYPKGTWASPAGWSEDSKGGGWLRDAVKGVPGLAAAILANGLAIHPYGAVGQNTHDDWGVSSAAAMESVAGAVLGSIPPFYITEFGYDLTRCGKEIGACSKKDQASRMRDAYNVFLADSHILGIWWYQSHDDGTGRFGYMNDSNTTRRAFRTLSGIAAAVGQ